MNEGGGLSNVYGKDRLLEIGVRTLLYSYSFLLCIAPNAFRITISSTLQYGIKPSESPPYSNCVYILARGVFTLTFRGKSTLDRIESSNAARTLCSSSRRCESITFATHFMRRQIQNHTLLSRSALQYLQIYLRPLLRLVEIT